MEVCSCKRHLIILGQLKWFPVNAVLFHVLSPNLPNPPSPRSQHCINQLCLWMLGTNYLCYTQSQRIQTRKLCDIQIWIQMQFCFSLLIKHFLELIQKGVGATLNHAKPQISSALRFCQEECYGFCNIVTSLSSRIYTAEAKHSQWKENINSP